MYTFICSDDKNKVLETRFNEMHFSLPLCDFPFTN